MDTRIDRMAETPSMLAQLVADATDALLDATAGDEWNARTVLAHLRDDEYLCMRPALERALVEDRPTVVFIEGSDWEPGRNRTRERREWLLADFALQRQATVSILRALRPDEWERGMQTADGKQFTVFDLVNAWLSHDATHIAQVEALVGETVQDVVARRSEMVDARTGRTAGG